MIQTQCKGFKIEKQPLHEQEYDWREPHELDCPFKYNVLARCTNNFTKHRQAT